MKPHIVLIDDQYEEAERISQAVTLTGTATATALYPADVNIEEITEADLVLLDYDLDGWLRSGTWKEADVMQPRNGIALAQVLAQQIWKREVDPPTGFALITGKPGDLAYPLPADSRLHILARVTGLEWVFEKGSPNLTDRVIELAYAINALPSDWERDEERNLANLLGISEISYETGIPENEFQEDVLRCLPPIHEISEWTEGLAVIRWLVQRVLPYPTFLVSFVELCARCGVSMNEVPVNVDLERVFAGARYRGILSHFCGPKWWKNVIEDTLWKETDGEAFDQRAVRSALLKTFNGGAQDEPACEEPVLCYDETLNELPDLYEVREAIRIWPDDWPSYAQQPWTPLELAVASPRLGDLVIYEDWSRLKTGKA